MLNVNDEDVEFNTIIFICYFFVGIVVLVVDEKLRIPIILFADAHKQACFHPVMACFHPCEPTQSHRFRCRCQWFGFFADCAVSNSAIWVSLFTSKR